MSETRTNHGAAVPTPDTPVPPAVRPEGEADTLLALLRECFSAISCVVWDEDGLDAARGLALLDRLHATLNENPPRAKPLAEEIAGLREDKARLDWLQERVDGTGETLLIGGVCFWRVDVQRSGPRSKITRLGIGDDLREAVDAARTALEGR